MLSLLLPSITQEVQDPQIGPRCRALRAQHLLTIPLRCLSEHDSLLVDEIIKPAAQQASESADETPCLWDEHHDRSNSGKIMVDLQAMLQRLVPGYTQHLSSIQNLLIERWTVPIHASFQRSKA